ncbi:MAG: hypothetical protein JNL42_13290 [Anaerolineae bacterium]|nr:hypothetical protein [Anaerolineae bacterium]
MEEFLRFLGFLNLQLRTLDIARLERFMMPASFSSLVGEFLDTAIPKYCPSLVKNRYHNGHPDLVPIDKFINNSILHGDEGIEIKASRYKSGWQGHNAEAVWLMVFTFDANGANEESAPRSFRFSGVYAAELALDDWSFSGRSGTSRRTITASVKQSGATKMKSNWIYRAS